MRVPHFSLFQHKNTFQPAQQYNFFNNKRVSLHQENAVFPVVLFCSTFPDLSCTHCSDLFTGTCMSCLILSYMAGVSRSVLFSLTGISSPCKVDTPLLNHRPSFCLSVIRQQQSCCPTALQNRLF